MPTPVELTPVTLARTGIDIAGTAAAATANGNFFANTGKEVLLVKNASISSINVTIVTEQEVKPGAGVSLAVADRVVAVGAGVEKAIGPFDKSIYNDENGDVNFTVSLETSITVKVLKFP